jgi:hypothetical protein
MITSRSPKRLVVALFISVTFSALPTLASPPEQAIGYWTQSAMNSAKPVSLSVDPKTGLGTLSVEPLASNTIGADWTDGGTPQSAVGKVFFSIGRSNYVCSASIVQDGLANVSIVITAAHCAIDRGKFVTNWAFVPDYDNGNRTPWYAKNLVVRTEFASQRQFNKTAIEHDWAFAAGTFTKNSRTYQNPPTQLDAVGAFAYSETGFSAVGQLSTAFGYPAADPYTGLLLKYAQGVIANDPNGYATWGMPSDLTGGASGGPWLSNLSSGLVSSVNSYKYTTDNSRMYGPKFGTKTTATFNAAKAATGSTDVINR